MQTASDKMLAPFRQQVAESGMTEEELDELFMEARRDYWRELTEREKSQAISDGVTTNTE